MSKFIEKLGLSVPAEALGLRPFNIKRALGFYAAVTAGTIGAVMLKDPELVLGPIARLWDGVVGQLDQLGELSNQPDGSHMRDVAPFDDSPNIGDGRQLEEATVTLDPSPVDQRTYDENLVWRPEYSNPS